jgi:MoaA/NifB/PqqE/SkfB family radical SAM enzyme
LPLSLALALPLARSVGNLAPGVGLSPTGIAPVLQVHPSRRCNLACAHCYSSSGPGAPDGLELELLAACLEDAAALGYRQLAVSGGEPLLYAQLDELLARGRALGMVTTVTSNGMLLSPDRWRPLAPLVDVLAISIDGAAAEHDALRRRAGAFAATVANLRVLRASGTRFGFLFTLTQNNVDSLESVVRLAAAEGAASVQVHPLTLHGRAQAALPGARPDGVELGFALLEAARLERELGVPVHVDALTRPQLVEHRHRLVPARPATDLLSVAPILVVQSDATVLPLTHEVSPELRLGSLARAPLVALARGWLAAGRGDRLALACARTWEALVRSSERPAAYWYDEVAARTQAAPPQLAGTPAIRARAGRTLSSSSASSCG